MLTLTTLIERFIQRNLVSFLNEFDVIYRSQSGFRFGHSIETALSSMTENWLKAINDGKIVGTVIMVMVDFTEDFAHELL